MSPERRACLPALLHGGRGMLSGIPRGQNAGRVGTGKNRPGGSGGGPVMPHGWRAEIENITDAMAGGMDGHACVMPERGTVAVGASAVARLAVVRVVRAWNGRRSSRFAGSSRTILESSCRSQVRHSSRARRLRRPLIFQSQRRRAADHPGPGCIRRMRSPAASPCNWRAGGND